MNFEIQLFYRILLLAFLHNFLYFILILFLLALYLAFFYVVTLTLPYFNIFPALFWVQFLIVILLFDSFLWLYHQKNPNKSQKNMILKGLFQVIMSILALFLANLLLAWQRMAFIGYRKGFIATCILNLLKERQSRVSINEITKMVWELEKKSRGWTDEHQEELKQVTQELLKTLKSLKNLGLIEFNWIVDTESPLLAIELTPRGLELVFSRKEKE